MTSTLRNRIAATAGCGALAMAAAMLGGEDGLEGMRHTPYRDVVGVLSVCYGHTGKDIKAGRYYTDRECQALLNEDLEKVAAQIDPVIKVKIPDTTRAALYSFTYNVGISAFKSSTLLQKLNAGDRKGVCDALRRWVYADGKKWKGLMNRRKIEREVCLWEKS